MPIELVAGWTEEISYTLSDDGVAVNLSGATVTIEATNAYDKGISLAGTVTVTDEAGGVVQFAPAVGDISGTGQPYYIRFKIVASDGKISHFPSGAREKWSIRE